MVGTMGRGACALGAALALSGSAGAQGERRMLALHALEPGQWQLQAIGNARIRPRSLCLGDPAILIQLEHPQANCSQVVVTNQPQSLTVHYVCPLGGFGQTSLRLDTPRVARIETQGIAANAPFSYSVQLRRLGPCGQRNGAPR